MRSERRQYRDVERASCICSPRLGESASVSRWRPVSSAQLLSLFRGPPALHTLLYSLFHRKQEVYSREKLECPGSVDSWPFVAEKFFPGSSPGRSDRPESARRILRFDAGTPGGGIARCPFAVKRLYSQGEMLALREGFRPARPAVAAEEGATTGGGGHGVGRAEVRFGRPTCGHGRCDPSRGGSRRVSSLRN